MEFYVNLLKVTEVTTAGKKLLKSDCIKITDEYFFYEGNTEHLGGGSIDFSILSEGIVGSLGGLSKEELVEVALEKFDMPNKVRDFFESILDAQ